MKASSFFLSSAAPSAALSTSHSSIQSVYTSMGSVRSEDARVETQHERGGRGHREQAGWSDKTGVTAPSCHMHRRRVDAAVRTKRTDAQRGPTEPNLRTGVTEAANTPNRNKKQKTKNASQGRIPLLLDASASSWGSVSRRPIPAKGRKLELPKPTRTRGERRVFMYTCTLTIDSHFVAYIAHPA